MRNIIPQTSDIEIIKNVKKKVAYHNSQLYNPLPPMEVEDVEQNVLMRVYTYRDTFDPSKSSLKTWIGTIAKNCLVDYCKKRPKQDFEYDLPVHDFRYDWLKDHISLLSDRRRRVFEEVLNGKEREDIAREMGITTNAVYGLLHNATQELRGMYIAEHPNAA